MKATASRKLRLNGFALVVTLSLMILLTVIAVGLLSLSAISLRSSSQTMAQAEARSNARLALMLAIGELQKTMGPDQRVSASGAITDTDPSKVKNPHWTGVWDSWKAGTEASGGDETSEHSTIAGATNKGMSPTYQAQRKDHFRSWLVSLDPADTQNPLSPVNLKVADNQNPEKFFQPDMKADAVWLVRDGSLGRLPDGKPDPTKFPEYVGARLLSLKSASGTNPSGRYGWWIGDESQKARILEDSYNSKPPQNLAEKVFRQQAPGSTGTTTVRGLENLVTDRQLKGLPSLKSLDLVSGATGKPAENFHSVTPYSYQVLADVREGGLKRDLSTLLERPIAATDTSNEFMLYKFDTKQWAGANQESVPIQDLAAYYQLYDSKRAGWQDGVRYSSQQLASGLQLISSEFGQNKGNDPAFARQYSSIYRQPVPVKLQFLMSMFGEKINPPPSPTNPAASTHVLRVGVTPSMTFWNPYNVPLLMNFDSSNPNRYAQLMRMGPPPLTIKWKKGNGYESGDLTLTWFSYGSMTDGKAQFLNLFFSGKRAVRFEPGEVKTFSLPLSGDTGGIKKAGDQHNTSFMTDFFFKTDKFYEGHEVAAGWDPRSYLLFNRSTPYDKNKPNDTREVVVAGAGKRSYLAFNANDTISFEMKAEKAVSGDSFSGAPFYFRMIQANHQCYAAYGGTEQWGRNNYVFNSRNEAGDSFSKTMFTKGFPGGAALITAAPRTGKRIIDRSASQEGWPFMQFSLQAAVETNEAANGGLGGRKYASRPFLHSSALAMPFLDDHTGASLYNTGWNWSISDINEIFEAPVEVSPVDQTQGFYGGGHTIGTGTTHLIQQEIPVVPPISIAALSHARLGGFSIANEINPGLQTNQVVTATGQGGLFPNTLQAIGNSYAHPLLSADKAFNPSYQRTFKGANAQSITFADHSYLANKALWDEFFFSSITPQPSTVKAFGRTTDTDAKTVARDFFRINDSQPSTPLPNRRITPYITGLDSTKFDAMFTDAERMQFTGGLADKIAAHLMVEGPFNVNSTSVEAWKVLLSSLKGKPVVYLDKVAAMNGNDPSSVSPTGTPVGQSSLAGGQPYKGSSGNPATTDQWTSHRELADTEIEELATALVKQVKLRGPFLSLSEFINRRLDAGNEDLSVKGALQAALDDPSVSINSGFRDPARTLSDTDVKPVFKKALEGPVAYGSSAYVDQADVLRNIAEQLTPRGDTFVIRTYGDSIDASGKIQARVWCEAVVQRLPEYIDASNPPQTKAADTSLTNANKIFGRKFQIVSLRWLGPSEV